MKTYHNNNERLVTKVFNDVFDKKGSITNLEKINTLDC